MNPVEMRALPSLRGLILAPILMASMLACGSDDGGDIKDACDQSTLIAQCPPASNPILGSQAEGQCQGAVDGVVSDLEGRATGSCNSNASCRLYCQFSSPCLCGVESVTKDGVKCATCNGISGCGDGLCADGENPDSCAIDCAAQCTAGETRCQGEGRQECNLQGAWETLACPSGEVCDVTSGTPTCVRGDIIRPDAGDAGGDGGTIDESRVIFGDATNPGTGSSARPGDGRGLELVGPLGLQGANVLLATIGGGWQVTPRSGGDGFDIFGASGWATVDKNGDAVWSGDAPMTEGEFCAEVGPICSPRDTSTFCPTWFTYLAGDPTDARHRCVLARAESEGCDFLDLIIVDFGASACPEPVSGGLYPDGDAVPVEHMSTDIIIAPDHRRVRIPLTEDDRSGSVLRIYDRDADVVRISEAGGEYQASNTPPAQFAWSGDGERFAWVASAISEAVVFVWDHASQQRTAIVPSTRDESPLALALSPQGNVLATTRITDLGAGPEIVVDLWNVAEDDWFLRIRKPPSSTNFGSATGGSGLAFSPAGDLLAITVPSLGIVELWDISTAERTFELDTGAVNQLTAMRFSPDGSTLAVVSGPHSEIRLWDTTSGSRLQTLVDPGSPTSFRYMHYSPDGTRLILVTASSTAVYGKP